MKLTRRFEWRSTAPWEDEIQGFIRQAAVPFRPPRYCLIAHDDQGVAAVLMYSLEDAPLIRLDAIAVEMRHRRCGGDLADDALAELFNRAFSVIREGVVTIEMQIHIKNTPSQAFALRNGFINSGQASGSPRFGGHYEAWRIEVPVA